MPIPIDLDGSITNEIRSIIYSKKENKRRIRCFPLFAGNVSDVNDSESTDDDSNSTATLVVAHIGFASFAPTSVMAKCPAILKSGARKGQPCGKTACGIHGHRSDDRRERM